MAHPTELVAALGTLSAVLLGLLAWAMLRLRQRDRARTELLASELEVMSRVARYANSPALVTDAEGVVIWVNDAFVRQTGHSAPEAVGRPVVPLLRAPDTDPAIRARTDAALREVSREGEQFSWWPDSEQAELLNLGYRFDYQILTPGMRRSVRSARLVRQPRFSQHAPLLVDYDWTLSI